jgi:ribosomal protein S18 acetylase RimI-like enzyme
VLPQSQGKGLGRRLLEHALEYLRQQGMECARIETLEQNPIGSHLYPGLGFEEVARQIHYAMRL